MHISRLLVDYCVFELVGGHYLFNRYSWQCLCCNMERTTLLLCPTEQNFCVTATRMRYTHETNYKLARCSWSFGIQNIFRLRTSNTAFFFFFSSEKNFPRTQVFLKNVSSSVPKRNKGCFFCFPKTRDDEESAKYSILLEYISIRLHIRSFMWRKTRSDKSVIIFAIKYGIWETGDLTVIVGSRTHFVETWPRLSDRLCTSREKERRLGGYNDRT